MISPFSPRLTQDSVSQPTIPQGIEGWQTIVALGFALWSDSNPVYASLNVSPSNRTTISAGFTHSK